MFHPLKQTNTPFREILLLEKAICYLKVNWSGPEQGTRGMVAEILKELGPAPIPVFLVDCSGSESEHIQSWLVAQANVVMDFKFGGWGEIIYLNNGQIIHFILNPKTLGWEKTKATLSSWMF